MRSLFVFIAAGFIFIFNCASTYSIRSLFDENEPITKISTDETALLNTFPADDSDTSKTYLTQYSDLLEPVEIAQVRPAAKVRPAAQNQPNAGKQPADTPAQSCPSGTGRACCIGAQLVHKPDLLSPGRGRQPPSRPVQGNCRWADLPGNSLSEFWCDDPVREPEDWTEYPGVGYDNDPERSFTGETGKKFCCKDIQSGVGIECDPLEKKSAITRESVNNVVKDAVNKIRELLGPVIESVPKINPDSLIPDH